MIGRLLRKSDFERVLAVQPDNARARAEIGRAYLALGESVGARRELETVRNQNVPPEVARAIDRLLSAIDRALTVLREMAEAASRIMASEIARRLAVTEPET